MSSKNMQYHLHCSSFKASSLDNGLGCVVLSVEFYRGSLLFCTLKMSFDFRNLNNTWSISGVDDVFTFSIDFLMSFSDYFYHVCVDEKLFQTKCLECKNCYISCDSDFSNEYRCSIGNPVVLDHVKTGCIHYDKRGSRIGKLTKSYLQAANIFGTDFVNSIEIREVTK